MKNSLLIFLKLLLGVLILIYCYGQAKSGGDFNIYLGAAELLKEGKNCYNIWISHGGDNFCGYSYSPFFATILIPFTYLPHPITPLSWLLLNIFFLYRLLIIIRAHLPVHHFSKKQYRLWAFLSLLLSIRFILHNYEMVQMTIFLLYCCMESVYQMKKNRYLISGILLAVGIIIKIIPIIILPYFIYRKQLKPAMVTVIFTILFLFFPAMFFTWDFNTVLLSDWLSVIHPNNTQFVYDQNKHGEGIHSLSGFLAGYFSANNGIESIFRRTVLVLKQDTFSQILNITRLAFIVATIYFLRLPFFVKSKSKTHSFWELSYICCIAPLIFPHQQKYAFIFIAPATMYILFYLLFIYNKNIVSKFKYRALILAMVIFFTLTTLTTDGIIGHYLNDLSEYYKTITFGVFILIFLLFSSNPDHLYFDKKAMD